MSDETLPVETEDHGPDCPEKIGPLPNPRHERYAHEYLIDLNARRAYMRTYPDAGIDTATVNGSRLLARPDVAARIAELQAERADRTGITVDRVLEELAVVGFSNIQHFQLDEEGNVALSPDAPETAWRAVSSIKRKVRSFRKKDDDVVEVETEIRLWDKPSSLRLAGQHLGMYTEKHEVTGKDGGPVEHAVRALSDEDLVDRVRAVAAALPPTAST